MKTRILRAELYLMLVLGLLQAAPGLAQTKPDRLALLNGTVLSIRGETVEEVFTLPAGRIGTRVEPLEDGWIVGGVIETEGGVDLSIMRKETGAVRELEPPGGAEAAWRAWATPVVLDGRLLGLLWLEGEQHNRLAVRAAEWRGDGWGPTEIVSSPGPGSQIAIAGVGLEDGSWLAVWTWVDATGDSETVWSLRGEKRWSQADRIHEDNRLHDIQPILAGVEGGALVVWNAFDGRDYRLRRARYSDGGWTLAGYFGGRGAGDLEFVETRVGTDSSKVLSLLFGTVSPSTWSVVEFDSVGGVAGAAQVARADHDGGPIFLVRDEEGGLRLLSPSFEPGFSAESRSIALTPDGVPGIGPPGASDR